MQRSAARFATGKVGQAGRAILGSGRSVLVLRPGAEEPMTKMRRGYYQSHRIDLGVEEEEVEEWNCKKAPDSALFVNADKMPVRSMEELQHETLALLTATTTHQNDHAPRL